MRREIKIAITIASVVVVLPIAAVVVLFLVGSQFESLPGVRREMTLPNQASLIIDGQKSGRSEHGFSQRAGYRPAGSGDIEWFGELSDGVEPQCYQAGSLVVVIDLPAAQLYVRTADKNWKSMALIFPNDLGPSFPLSFYAERSGLTMEEISRIDELGGKRDQKWPTTYIQNFDPETRDLTCSYHVDNKSSWPLRLRLSEDGSHLGLISIGELSR